MVHSDKTLIVDIFNSGSLTLIIIGVDVVLD